MTDTAQHSAFPTFELSSSGIQARAQLRDGQFVVLAGSAARADVVDSFPGHGYWNLREQLLQNGMLRATDNGSLTYPQDTAFRSASAAAAVTLGRASNGNTLWTLRDTQGQTLAYGEWLLTPEGRIAQGGAVPAVEVDWPPFFRALAEALLPYEQRQEELVALLNDIGVAAGNDGGLPLKVMDPLTFVLNLKKYTRPDKLAGFFTELHHRLNLNVAVPIALDGFSVVPIANGNGAANLFPKQQDRGEHDLADLWALARQALAGNLSDETFGRVLSRSGATLPKLTQALYILGPGQFLPLGQKVQTFLEARGVRGSGQVQTGQDFAQILEQARPMAPDFISLAVAAQRAAVQPEVTLQGGTFPFTQFRDEAARYAADRVKGNLVLDRRYAPLLLELTAGDFAALKPARSPYSGREQLAVKVALGGGVKTDGGVFGRALLFADDSGFEYVTFPAGLTLEVGLPDGKGDGPRQALQAAEVQAELLDTLNAPLPAGLQATLTLNTDFGPLTLLPLGPAQHEEAAQKLEQYARGLGLSRRLRVGLSLSPGQLESEELPELMDAALAYLDTLSTALDRLMRQGEERGVAEGVIEVPGTQPATPAAFVPVPGVPLNQILYGPPGTGKTYRVVDEALSVLDPAALLAHPGSEGRAARKARYDTLAAQGRISFVTFHQSFGYEDFIEGIKPVMAGGALSYVLQDGVFLDAVSAAGGDLAGTAPQAAPTSEPLVRPDAQVWRIYIDGTAPVSQIRERSLARGELRIGSWLGGSLTLDGRPPVASTKPADLSTLPEDQLNAQQHAFKDSLRVGDLILLATGIDRIGAVGVVTGEYHFDMSEPLFAANYAHARQVQWLAHGLSASATATLNRTFSQQTLQRVAGVTAGDVLAKLDLVQTPEPAASPAAPTPRAHVLIIDEINRGNISKIFGELITLLEGSKRAGAAEALTVTLPLSRRPLGVPQSLYVIGTMNTADRSLTLLDAALRRRFVFRPVWPEPEVLPVLTLEGGTALDLRKFLYIINERIERLLSREQVIGHAYLLGLPATLDGVASAVRERILPLLEEYFFEDWSKIREVLGDPGRPPALQFIHQVGSGPDLRYRLNPDAFGEIEAFTGVYGGVDDAHFPFNA